MRHWDANAIFYICLQFGDLLSMDSILPPVPSPTVTSPIWMTKSVTTRWTGVFL